VTVGILFVDPCPVALLGLDTPNLKVVQAHMLFNPALSQQNSRRRLAVLGLLLATLAFCVAQIMAPAGAHAATLSLDQCNNNGPGPSGATTAMTCSVVVVNTINGAHRGSVTTLTRTCLLGPCAPGNGTFVSSSTAIVTSVNQCNGSNNDTGQLITCTVTITNNISSGTTAAHPVTAATVNQCVGSATGGGGTVNCDPFPATTTGATVTQCNGSATGGGGTVHCTVAPESVVSPAVPVTVNQCNGTGNAGGSVVTCFVRILTHITPAATTTTGTTTTGTTTKAKAAAAAKAKAAAAAKARAAAARAAAAGQVSNQVSQVPSGGVATGGGSTSGLQDRWLLLAGAGLLTVSAGSALRSRRARHER
jgi:hypothetical protein